MFRPPAPCTVRTNEPGNLARRRNPFVIQSVIGPSSCFRRFRRDCSRASVAVPATRSRGPEEFDMGRDSCRQAKKDRLPPDRSQSGPRRTTPRRSVERPESWCSSQITTGWRRQRGRLNFERGEREIVRSRGVLPPFRVVAGLAAADFARRARAGDEAPRGLRAPWLLSLSAWLWCACRRRRHGFGFRCWNGGFLGGLRTSSGSCSFVFREAALLIFAARAART